MAPFLQVMGVNHICRAHLLLFLLFCGCSPTSPRSGEYSLGQTDLCIQVCKGIESGAVCPGDYPSEQWWIFFQDQQLDRLVNTSLACHPSIEIAQARINRACAEALEVRSALLPHLYLFGDIQRQRVSEFAAEIPGDPILFTEGTLQLTNLSYELDIWQKNRSRYYSALDRMEAQIADFKQAEIVLSTAVAGAYFDLQMQLVRHEINKGRLKSRQELYALLRQQFDRGIISEYRLYETDTEVQMIRDRLLVIEALIEADKHALAALVGNTGCCGGELCVEPSAQFNGSFPIPSTLSIDLLARRPDITAQIWRIKASCYDIRAAKARFFPTIDLIGLAGYQSFKLAKLFTAPTLTILGEASGLLPLFTAGKLRAQLGVAQEDLEIAIGEYNQLVLDAVQQVSDALSGLITATQRVEVLDRSIKDAEELYDLTNEKFTNGIVNKIPLLNAIENVCNQKELEALAWLDRFSSAVDLVRAIGGGYDVCGE